MFYFNKLQKVDDWDAVETATEMYKLYDDAGDIYLTMVSDDMCRVIVNKNGEHIDLTHSMLHDLITIMNSIDSKNEDNY